MIPSQPATTTEKPLAEVLVEGELSPFEDEKIYRILREKFKVQHPTYSHPDDMEMATRVNITFNHPYSVAFFTGLGEKWRELKEILKEIRHRRGNAGAGYTITFNEGERKLAFISGVLEDREFSSSLDQVSYLTSIIGQTLRPEIMEKPLVTMETTFDKRYDRWSWFRGLTSASEGYVFDEAGFRWVRL